MEIRVIDGNPVVTTTDVRNNLSTILDRVLNKYGKAIIEQKGKPVAVLTRLEDDSDYRMEKF